MKALFSFAWVAGFMALALFCIRDVRLCQWFMMAPAVWGIGVALGQGTAVSHRFFGTVAILAGGYALIIIMAWVLAGVAPDWAYLRGTGPFLLAGMLAPACCLEIGPLQPAKWKWIWLGLFLVVGCGIEANNLGWINYHRLHAGSLRATWDIWTEKYYIYSLLLLVWACVAFFSWRRRLDRLVVLALMACTAVLIFGSGRSLRSLAILACGMAVFFLLTTVTVSRRQLNVAVALLVLTWGGAPWVFKLFDLSRVQRQLRERTQIYAGTHELILQRPWFGHGFGQAMPLTHPLLPKRFNQHLPGGHPHNLALLFWLEYGVVGALFLCGVTWYLLQRVIERAHGRDSWPALAALIATFVVMVSFSWDIWEYPIILFYAGFAGLVVLLLNLDEGPGAEPHVP